MVIGKTSLMSLWVDCIFELGQQPKLPRAFCLPTMLAVVR
jgi:hypothetical protein